MDGVGSRDPKLGHRRISVSYKNKWKQVDFQKEWYQKNKERLKEKHKAYRKEHKPTVMAWFVEYKKTLCCVRCGESHPACLQFHHRDSSSKRFTISAAVRLCVCIEELLEEMNKCDVLCGNCHAKLHAEECGAAGRENMHRTVAPALHRFESDAAPQMMFDWES